MKSAVIFPVKTLSVGCILWLVTACAVPPLVATQGNGPEPVVQEMYATFGKVFCDDVRRPQLFEARLAQNIARACNEDLFLYTGNPVIPGNDYLDSEITSTLVINCQSQGEMVCNASFTSFGEPHTVRYFFVQQGGSWLISDIVRGDDISFREDLEVAISSR